MKLLQRIKAVFVKVWRWYYNKCLAEDDVDQEKVDNLVWISRKLDNGTYSMMGNVDTIEMAIDRMPVQEETIFEVSTIEQAERIVCTIQQEVV